MSIRSMVFKARQFVLLIAILAVTARPALTDDTFAGPTVGGPGSAKSFAPPAPPAELKFDRTPKATSDSFRSRVSSAAMSEAPAPEPPPSYLAGTVTVSANVELSPPSFPAAPMLPAPAAPPAPYATEAMPSYPSAPPQVCTTGGYMPEAACCPYDSECDDDGCFGGVKGWFCEMEKKLIGKCRACKRHNACKFEYPVVLPSGCPYGYVEPVWTPNCAPPVPVMLHEMPTH